MDISKLIEATRYENLHEAYEDRVSEILKRENERRREEGLHELGTGGSRTERYSKLGNIRTAEELSNYEEVKAAKQSGREKLFNGFMRMHGTAVITAADSILGTIYGVGSAIANGDASKIWDNSISNWFADLNTKLNEDYFANYQSKAEQNASWWNRLLTSGGIADNILANLGFMEGMVLSAAIPFGPSGVAMKGVSLVTKAIGRTAKTVQGYNKIMKAGNFAKSLVGSAMGSIGEARIEAINSVKAYQDLAEQNIASLYSNKEKELKEVFANDIANGMSPTEAHAKYQEGKANLDKEAEKIKANVASKRRNIGDATFALNMGILTFSNAFQFGKTLFSGGFEGQRALKNLIFKLGGKEGETLTGKEGAKALGKAMADKAVAGVEAKSVGNFYGKVAAKGVKNMIAEGVEEGAQNIISGGNQRKALAEVGDFMEKESPEVNGVPTLFGSRLNKEATAECANWLSAFGETIKDEFGSIENGGWEEFFSGAIIGAIGLPGFKFSNANKFSQSKGTKEKLKTLLPTGISASGGFAEAYKEMKGIRDARESYAKEINDFISSDESRKQMEHAISTVTFSNLMDKAVASGDRVTYDQSKISLLADTFHKFSDWDMVDAFKEYYKGTVDHISADDIELLKQMSRVKPGESVENNTLKTIQEGITAEEQDKRSRIQDPASLKKEYEKLYGSDWETSLSGLSDDAIKDMYRNDAMESLDYIEQISNDYFNLKNEQTIRFQKALDKYAGKKDSQPGLVEIMIKDLSAQKTIANIFNKKANVLEGTGNDEIVEEYRNSADILNNRVNKFIKDPQKMINWYDEILKTEQKKRDYENIDNIKKDLSNVNSFNDILEIQKNTNENTFKKALDEITKGNGQLKTNDTLNSYHTMMNGIGLTHNAIDRAVKRITANQGFRDEDVKGLSEQFKEQFTSFILDETTKKGSFDNETFKNILSKLSKSDDTFTTIVANDILTTLGFKNSQTTGTTKSDPTQPEQSEVVEDQPSESEIKTETTSNEQTKPKPKRENEKKNVDPNQASLFRKLKEDLNQEISDEDLKNKSRFEVIKEKARQYYSSVFKNSESQEDKDYAGHMLNILDTIQNKESKEEINKALEKIKEKIPFTIVNSREEIEDEYVLEQLEKGEIITGWYDPKTGRAYVYTPNIDNVNTATKTLLHEVIAHKGLRDLLGEEYDIILDNVFKSMSETDKKKFLEYVGNNNERAAANEYIAHLAEQNKKPSLWDKIVSWVKEALKKIGIKIDISDRDLRVLLDKSLKNFSSRERKDFKTISDTTTLRKESIPNSLTVKGRGKMSFAYNGQKRNDVKSLTTLEAIKNGERTATTRYSKDGNINYWKNFKQGDIIEFSDNNGNKVFVEITKPLTKIQTPKTNEEWNNLAEEWSKKEGWNIDHFNKTVKPQIGKGEAYQFEFKFIESIKEQGNSLTDTYEVSTAGDSRFSALNARFKEGTILFGQDLSGMSIETAYQKILKRSSKGKAPAINSRLNVIKRGYAGIQEATDLDQTVSNSAVDYVNSEFNAGYHFQISNDNNTVQEYAELHKDNAIKNDKYKNKDQVKALVSEFYIDKEAKVSYYDDLVDYMKNANNSNDSDIIILKKSTSNPNEAEVIVKKGKKHLIHFRANKSVEDITYEQGYKPLWDEWAKQNPELIKDLAIKSKGKTLTDKFAKTSVNQARALTDILQNYKQSLMEPIISKAETDTPVLSWALNNGVDYANKNMETNEVTQDITDHSYATSDFAVQKAIIEFTNKYAGKFWEEQLSKSEENKVVYLFKTDDPYLRNTVGHLYINHQKTPKEYSRLILVATKIKPNGVPEDLLKPLTIKHGGDTYYIISTQTSQTYANITNRENRSAYMSVTNLLDKTVGLRLYPLRDYNAVGADGMQSTSINQPLATVIQDFSSGALINSVTMFSGHGIRALEQYDYAIDRKTNTVKESFKNPEKAVPLKDIVKDRNAMNIVYVTNVAESEDISFNKFIGELNMDDIISLKNNHGLEAGQYCFLIRNSYGKFIPVPLKSVKLRHFQEDENFAKINRNSQFGKDFTTLFNIMVNDSYTKEDGTIIKISPAQRQAAFNFLFYTPRTNTENSIETKGDSFASAGLSINESGQIEYTNKNGEKRIVNRKNFFDIFKDLTLNIHKVGDTFEFARTFKISFENEGDVLNYYLDGNVFQTTIKSENLSTSMFHLAPINSNGEVYGNVSKKIIEDTKVKENSIFLNNNKIVKINNIMYKVKDGARTPFKANTDVLSVYNAIKRVESMFENKLFDQENELDKDGLYRSQDGLFIAKIDVNDNKFEYIQCGSYKITHSKNNLRGSYRIEKFNDATTEVKSGNVNILHGENIDTSKASVIIKSAKTNSDKAEFVDGKFIYNKAITAENILNTLDTIKTQLDMFSLKPEKIAIEIPANASFVNIISLIEKNSKETGTSYDIYTVTPKVIETSTTQNDEIYKQKIIEIKSKVNAVNNRNLSTIKAEVKSTIKLNKPIQTNKFKIENNEGSFPTITLKFKDIKKNRYVLRDIAEHLTEGDYKFGFSCPFIINTESAIENNQEFIKNAAETLLSNINSILGSDSIVKVYPYKQDGRIVGFIAGRTQEEFEQKTQDIAFYRNRNIDEGFLTAEDLKEAIDGFVYGIRETIDSIASDKSGKFLKENFGDYINEEISFYEKTPEEIINEIGFDVLASKSFQKYFSIENNKSIKELFDKNPDVAELYMSKLYNIQLNKEAFLRRCLKTIKIVLGQDVKFGLSDQVTENETSIDDLIEDLNESVDEDNDGETKAKLVKADNWTVDYEESLSPVAKRYMNNIFKIDENGNIEKNAYGMPKVVPVNEVYNKLISINQSCYTMEEFFEKIKEESAYYPYLKRFIEEYTDSNGILHSAINESNAATIIYQATNLAQMNYVIVNGNATMSNNNSAVVFLNDIEYLDLSKKITDITKNGQYKSAMLFSGDHKEFMKRLGITRGYNEAKMTKLLSNPNFRKLSPSKMAKAIISTFDNTSRLSVHENGKTYSAFVKRSSTDDISKKLTDTNSVVINNIRYPKNILYIYDNYGNIGQYRLIDSNGRTIWLNPWLGFINSNPDARTFTVHSVLNVKVRNEFNMPEKTEYKDLTEEQILDTWISSFFNDKSTNTTLYPVMVQADKNVFQLVRGPKFSTIIGNNGFSDTESIIFDNIFRQEGEQIKLARQVEQMKNSPLYGMKNFNKNNKKFNTLTFLNSEELTNSEDDQRLKNAIEDYLNGNLDDVYELKQMVINKYRQFAENQCKFIEQKSSLIQTIADLDTRKEHLREFYDNYFIATFSTFQILGVDPRFYKNFVELTKRNSQTHFNGITGIAHAKYDGKEVNDGYYRHETIKDIEVKSNVSKVLELIISKAKNDPAMKDTVEALEKIYSSKDALNVADGQSLISITAYRKKMISFGNGAWTRENEEAYQNYLNNPEQGFDSSSLKGTVTKSAIYAMEDIDTGIVSEDGNQNVYSKIKVPIQIKHSEYLALKCYLWAKENNIGTGSDEMNSLGEMIDSMEKSHFKDGVISPDNYKTDGIDAISFESTVKVGLSDTINISEVSDKIGTKENSIKKFSVENYRDVMETGNHQDESSQIGSQFMGIILSGFNPNSTLSYNNKTDVSVEEAYQDFSECIKTLTNIGYKKFAKKLFDVNHNPKNEIERACMTENISKTLERSIKGQEGNASLIANITTSITGEMPLPLTDFAVAPLVQKTIYSTLRNSIYKIKTNGGPLVQVAPVGMTPPAIKFSIKKNGKEQEISINELEGVDMTEVTRLSNIPKKNRTAEENEILDKASEAFKKMVASKGGKISIKHFECYCSMPKWMEPIIERFKNEEDGSYDMQAIESEYPDLLKMIGYRIPSESKHSIQPLKIVGFTPKEAGDVIILPQEIVLIAGSDFDVDKMYTMGYNFDKDGNKAEDLENATLNKIMDISWTALTHEDSLIEMLSPSTFKTFQENANKKDNSFVSLCDIKAHIDAIDKNTLDILAITAKANTSNLLMRLFSQDEEFNVNVDVPSIKLKLNNKKTLSPIKDGQININETADAYGRTISSGFAELLAGAADIAKDSALYDCGVTNETINIFNGMLLSGLPIQEAIRILKSGIISYLFDNITDIEKMRLHLYEMKFDIAISKTKSISIEDMLNASKSDDNNIKYMAMNLLLAFATVGQAFSDFSQYCSYNSSSSALGPTVSDANSKINRFERITQPESDYNLVDENVKARLRTGNGLHFGKRRQIALSIQNVIENSTMIDKPFITDRNNMAKKIREDVGYIDNWLGKEKPSYKYFHIVKNVKDMFDKYASETILASNVLRFTADGDVFINLGRINSWQKDMLYNEMNELYQKFNQTEEVKSGAVENPMISLMTISMKKQFDNTSGNAQIKKIKEDMKRCCNKDLSPKPEKMSKFRDLNDKLVRLQLNSYSPQSLLREMPPIVKTNYPGYMDYYLNDKSEQFQESIQDQETKSLMPKIQHPKLNEVYSFLVSNNFSESQISSIFANVEDFIKNKDYCIG